MIDVVVDTNVVVAGLITGDQASPVARVLDGMLAARWPFALSEPLIAEYDRVLRRPARACRRLPDSRALAFTLVAAELH